MLFTYEMRAGLFYTFERNDTNAKKVITSQKFDNMISYYI